MRMAVRRRSGLLELAEMRLPLIALIDVILFLLMYFLLAGSLEAEERELASTLGSGSTVAGDSGGFTPQVVEVAMSGGNVAYRIGGRSVGSRESLADLVPPLPGGALLSGNPVDWPDVFRRHWAAARADRLNA